MFISEYLKPGVSLDEIGVFDSMLDKDSHFFINIICLKKSTIPEFIEAYNHINKYFTEIATLLDAADEAKMSDKMFREARRRFCFHEVNGINLGFSETPNGAGWGDSISNKVLRDAYQIVKKGSKQPEIFHLVSLFEENVAGDRLSDMIATIIEPQIKQYTLRIMKDLDIRSKKVKGIQFLKDGLIKNPFKNAPILMLPKELLHELPIAKCWDDIDRVVTENEIIRREISYEIGAKWQKWARTEQKEYILRNVFLEPDVCGRVIEGYKKEDIPLFDIRMDPDYFAAWLLKTIKETESFKPIKTEPSSYEATIDILNIFKDWTENNRGWAVIQESPSKNREKAIQRFIHLCAKYYLKINRLDASFECNEGNGALDLKISRGLDKTVTEIKLSSNGRYLHGFETQLEQYKEAESTENSVYLFINIGNDIRKEKLLSLYEINKESGRKCPELFIVDAVQKTSASLIDTDDYSIDFNVGDWIYDE